MELNREQIIKALECCTDGDCYPCPYAEIGAGCRDKMCGDALSLINELTEENERLENALVEQSAENVILCGEVKNAKADTVRKMQKRLRGYYDDKEHYLGYSIAYNIDRVAEEMINGAHPSANKCVACGEIIPDGRQVCPRCEGGESG